MFTLPNWFKSVDGLKFRVPRFRFLLLSNGIDSQFEKFDD